MKCKYKSMYRKNGRTVFVYTVTGTEAQIQQYKEAQGSNLRVDEATGAPLFYSTRLLSFDPKESIDLIITSKGGVAVDESKKIFQRAFLVDQAAIAAEGTIIARQNLGLSNGEKAEAAPASAPAKPSSSIPAFNEELEDADIVEEVENVFAETAEGEEPTV